MLVESSDRFLIRKIDRVERCAATTLGDGFYDLQRLLSDIRPYVWCDTETDLVTLVLVSTSHNDSPALSRKVLGRLFANASCGTDDQTSSVCSHDVSGAMCGGAERRKCKVPRQYIFNNCRWGKGPKQGHIIRLRSLFNQILTIQIDEEQADAKKN
jgi:hypothetical protein